MSDVDRLAQAKPKDAERIFAGQITALVDGLPSDGAVVFVHSQRALAGLRDLILRTRGTAVLGRTRLIVAPDEADEVFVLAAVSVPVFRDPFILAQRAYLRALGAARRGR